MREFLVSNHLRVNLEEKKRGREGAILIGLVLLLLSVIPSVLWTTWFLMVGGTLFLILVAYGLSSGAGEKVLETGVRGENILKNRLNQMLSDEYIGLFNLPLPHGGDIDCFLIGPTGAYLFDVKNHNGYILYCNGQWTQTKVGKKGRVYEGNHLKDPSHQIRKGIFEIKRYLKKNGVNLWVNGAIVFTNPEAKVFSEDIEGIKVVKIEDLETIFKESKAHISPNAVQTIAKLVYEGFKKDKDVGEGRLYS